MKNWLENVFKTQILKLLPKPWFCWQRSKTRVPQTLKFRPLSSNFEISSVFNIRPIIFISKILFWSTDFTKKSSWIGVHHLKTRKPLRRTDWFWHQTNSPRRSLTLLTDQTSAGIQPFIKQNISIPPAFLPTKKVISSPDNKPIDSMTANDIYGCSPPKHCAFISSSSSILHSVTSPSSNRCHLDSPSL